MPGSQRPIADDAAWEEYQKCDEKMKAAVEWFRKECAAAEARASGRVTPALLSPVRVKMPQDDHLYKLEEIATVGVRDGSLLLITVFDEEVRMHYNFLEYCCFTECNLSSTSNTSREPFIRPSCPT